MKSYIIGIDPSLTNCGVSDGEQHTIVQTKPGDVDAIADLDNRCSAVCYGIANFVNERTTALQINRETKVQLFIEAPMLTAHGAGAHFLFEAGWLFHDLYTFLPTLLQLDLGAIRRVPSPTLRKWATGKGNAPKDVMKLKAFKKFGVEFERDPGCDKLFAFLLAKFGQEVVAGTAELQDTARRGKGKSAIQAARKRGAA